jgi:hypothetical protein
MKEKWRMLIADEDSAIIPAMKIFQTTCGLPDEFMHRLCAMHKKKQFHDKGCEITLG